MKGDAKVIEALNKGLKLELTAVSQYWLHFRLLDSWGYGKLAKKERAESVEEMHHADRFIDRILQLDGHPNLQTLDSLMIGQSLREVLECDLKGEYLAKEHYAASRKLCSDVGDYVSMKLFEELLAEEEGHIDHIETQLTLIDQIGVENYGALQAEAG